MDLQNNDKRLRYFMKVADFSSLSKTAEALQITQAALSSQIALLEEYLDKRLFTRTGRGVTLTDAGKRLYDGVAESYANIDRTIYDIREKDGVTDGVLRIAIIHTFGAYITSESLARFAASFNSVNVVLTAGSSPEVVDAVESGRADIGYVYASAVPESLCSAPLFEDVMCIIVKKDEAGDMSSYDISLNKPKLVGFPAEYPLRKMLKNAGLEDSVIAEGNTLESILHLVSSGIGKSIVTNMVSKHLLAEYGLVKLPIKNPTLARRLDIVIRKQPEPTTIAKRYFEISVGLSRNA